MTERLEPVGKTALLASDLIIEILPRWSCRFRGTAEQLIAEGLIPDGFKWPAKTQRHNWDDGQFDYWLQRCRPEGLKGPQSAWANGDYWVIDKSPKGRVEYSEHLIYMKKLELAEIIRRGQPESNQIWYLAYKAREDGRYMAFRTRLLGDLAPRKRGRPVKSTATTNGQS